MSRLRRVVRCAATLNSAIAGTGALSHVKLPDTASLLAVVPTDGYAETWTAVTRGQLQEFAKTTSRCSCQRLHRRRPIHTTANALGAAK